MTIAVTALRNRALLAALPTRRRDHLQMLLVAEGTVHVAGTAAPDPTLTSGSALLLFGSGSPRITSIGDSAVFVLDAPAQGRLGRLVAAANPLTITPGNPLVSLITALAESIVTFTGDLTWMSRHITENMLTDTLHVLVADVTRQRRSPRAPEVFGSALAMISAHSADADLTVERVAHDANLSLRQIERAFQKRGTTIVREIRRARVDHAIAVLTDESTGALTVDQIARLVGFSNNSSLARAMQAEGHASPAVVRDRALAGLVPRT